MIESMSQLQKLAVLHGAGVWAVKKWKVRKRVPLEWQVKLIQANPGMMTFADFERLHLELNASKPKP